MKNNSCLLIVRRCLLQVFFILIFKFTSAQQNSSISIHQQEFEYYSNIGITASEYEIQNKPAVKPDFKNNKACTLNKIVFSWHPYWNNGLEANYDWSLISDLSYFGYAVNASTGEPTNTYNWSTVNVVTEALANGIRVNLCVTLFSNHATFFASSTSQQTLIDNLISLVQSRGANGVNIDFEGVPSSEKTNFTNFLINLCTQMHTQISGSQVSIALYAVDWNSVFDIPVLNNYIDLFIIMGYDYYWSGSTTAGPNDPLYHFGTTYNYNLSKSITYYLNQGMTPSKLILGLPYYGMEYTTTSNTIPSSVLNPPNSTSRTYKLVRDNTSGNYTSGNKYFDGDSFSPVYIFQSGDWKQCFIDDVYSMGKRLDHVLLREIGGIGIWALGYDDGYSDFWNLLSEKLTDCYVIPCSDTIYDPGGPNKDYYNNENYTYTIAPEGASQVTLNFLSFDVEAGSGAVCDYDYLEIFDGPSTSSSSFGKFCNTTGSPGTIISSGNALTLQWHTDGATVNPGFTAIWTCSIDNIAPTTTISANSWATVDFIASFTDNDNENVALRFYQPLDWNSTEWRANTDNGFLNDNFQLSLNPEWTNISGNWMINSEHLNQTNEDSSNTNLYIPLEQQTGNIYLYHWQMSIGGSGTNRRAGLHFFCDDPTLLQRGNSYMVYFRVDQDKCQIYKSVNNSITIYTDDICSVEPNIWYDYKIIFNAATGEINAYQDNILVSSWTDPAPFTSGNSLSLRTGNCNVLYDNVKAYKQRNETSMISVGASLDDIRYQNPNPSTPSCRIKSIITDEAGNFSTLEGLDVNIDWTPPADITNINDGLAADVDTISNDTVLYANWPASQDTNSGIISYRYCIGTSPDSSDIVSWTDNGINTSVTVSGLSLSWENIYYFSVMTENGAGLFSNVTASDGQLLHNSIIDPVAEFTIVSDSVCEGEPVSFINGSINATSYSWSFPGGTPQTSADVNPLVYFTGGTYQVQLIAFGLYSQDTITHSVTVTVLPAPVANFYSAETEIYMPTPVAYFINASSNADYYYWSFGDGSVSTDVAPWHLYNDTGYYDISLIAYSDQCSNDTLILTGYIHILNPSLVSGILNDKLEVKISPNPFCQFFNILINIPNPGRVRITISDVTGREIALISDKFILPGLYNVKFNS
ncbi:MAG: hypothetical protein HY738_08740 [Bacteroidia bacterium]|nr:hypothetical protein [Bacteroidia bacterium]